MGCWSSDSSHVERPVSSIPLADDHDLADDLARAAIALAERFSAGATLWAVAPAQPEHARHLAVEFVHPVIVGKPALPAASVDGPDLVGRLRPLVRRGDIVVAIGELAHDVSAVLQRCPAWGAVAVRVGTGTRPAGSATDHLLWIDDDRGEAAHDGRLTLLYHLLWELTHLCLEHGSVGAAERDCPTAELGTCITCSDDARLGEIVEPGVGGLATVRIDGIDERVDVSLVEPVTAGQLVLVHAGSAIADVAAADAP